MPVALSKRSSRANRWHRSVISTYFGSQYFEKVLPYNQERKALVLKTITNGNNGYIWIGDPAAGGNRFRMYTAFAQVVLQRFFNEDNTPEVVHESVWIETLDPSPIVGGVVAIETFCLPVCTHWRPFGTNMRNARYATNTVNKTISTGSPVLQIFAGRPSRVSIIVSCTLTPIVDNFLQVFDMETNSVILNIRDNTSFVMTYRDYGPLIGTTIGINTSGTNMQVSMSEVYMLPNAYQM